MRRNSGYTRSANRAKAASSPLLQACNRFVISEGRAPMDSPFSRRHKKYIKDVAALVVRFRLYQRREIRYAKTDQYADDLDIHSRKLLARILFNGGPATKGHFRAAVHGHRSRHVGWAR